MPGTAGPGVWIDGAHNEDKIAALTEEAIRRSAGGPLPVVVFGMLRSKDPSRMLAKLLPGASSIVITEPFVVGRESLAVDALADCHRVFRTDTYRTGSWCGGSSC